MMLKRLGLIGYPLSHSHSPAIFERLLSTPDLKEIKYELFPLKSLDELPQLLKKHKDLIGFNVTIPYKNQILNRLTKLSPVATGIGAVNTVKVKRKGAIYELEGYNTDIYGFQQTLEEHRIQNKNALIFGDGGAAQAVKHALMNKNITFEVVTRNKSGLHYKDLTPETIRKYNLLINTTPVGMHPDIENVLPIPEAGITQEHTLIDLIYNPAETSFMKLGKKHGAKVINGALMLEKQAEKALEIWLSD